jgi:hypothetical protein
MSAQASIETVRPAWSGVLADGLFAPVHVASIAAFRVLFGLIMLWEVGRYFAYGWIDAFYLEPAFLFTYPGFGWVRPWPGDGLYWHFAGLGVLAAAIALGLFYRTAIVLFFLGFAYVFLLDQARYLNHFYLALLIAFLLCLVPASRAYALDPLLSSRAARFHAPAWTLWTLRLQFEVMYIYAGIVKLNGDWLQFEPLRLWLSASADLPLLGPWLLDERVIALAAYGAIALHVVGAPLLLIRRARPYVFVAYCAFHGLNSLFWDIGIFPWLTIAGTLLFFEPDWPVRMARRLGWPARGGQRPVPSAPLAPIAQGGIAAFVVGWAALQVLVPLRHLQFPGNVSWHEQGHQFSWQMMLRDKAGMAVFLIRDPQTGRVWQVEPEEHLTERQVRYMVGRPEMLRLYAHYLEDVFTRAYRVADVEVRALTAVSLNGRPAQPLLDPERDLTMIRYSLANSDWILPLKVALPPVDARWLADWEVVLERLKAEAEKKRQLCLGTAPIA